MISGTIAWLVNLIGDITDAVADYYRTLRLAYLSTKQSLISQSLLIEKNLDSLRETRLLVARNILNSISPNNAWERNDKYVWNVQLNRNVEPILNGLKDTLTNIANQCWGYGGDAVFVARAILDTFDIEWDNCNINARESSSNITETDNSVVIQPNPAHNSIKLHVNNGKGIDYALYNYLGAELISNPFVNDEMINISFLNNGMYLLKIQYQNEKGELVSKTLKFIKY